MRTTLFVAAVAVATTAMAACTTGDTRDPDNDQLDSPYATQSDPSGTYTTVTPKLDELEAIAIQADHHFTATRMVACPGGGTCAPSQETGRYLFTHSSTKKYIRLYDEQNNPIARYQWTLSSGGELKLELDGDTSFFALKPGAACAAVGGTCEALSPTSCESGSVGDATDYSCGGPDTTGTECCLVAPENNTCDVNSDCGGRSVPEYCRTCADGTTACAHWSCVDNACAVVSCPND